MPANERGRIFQMIRRTLPLVIPFLLTQVCVLSQVERAQADEITNLRVGETRQFPVSPGERVIVGNSQVLGYIVKPDSVFVSGRKSGFSTLTIGERVSSVSVFETGDLQEMQLAMKEMLKGVEGLQIRLVAGRLVLSGMLMSQFDLDRCKRVADALGAVSTLMLDPNYHLPTPVIKLAFHFAEVNKTVLQKIGIAWGNGVFTTVLDGLTVVNGVASLRAGSPGNLNFGELARGNGGRVVQDSSLDLTEAGNLFRVHDTHEAVVLNGHMDDYFYGGTLLIPVKSGLAVSLEKVDFGVSLKITPVMDRTGNVLLDLTYEVSDIAEDAPSGTYRLDKRRQKTTILVHEGATVALAGVLRNNAGRGHLGLPWLSRIPMLGSLFGSRSFQSGMTDGVIFITPTLVREQVADQRSRVVEIVKDLGSLPATNPASRSTNNQRMDRENQGDK